MNLPDVNLFIASLASRCSVGLAVFAALVCVPVNAQDAATQKSIIDAINSATLSGDQFLQLAKFIRASAKEDKWRETPWKSSVHLGRLAGEASGKPLFLWAMNGDPLGCV